MTGCCWSCRYFALYGPYPKGGGDTSYCWKGHAVPALPSEPPMSTPFVVDRQCGDFEPDTLHKECRTCAHFRVTCAGVSADPEWDGRNGSCSSGYVHKDVIESLGIDIRNPPEPRVRKVRQTTLEVFA